MPAYNGVVDTGRNSDATAVPVNFIEDDKAGLLISGLPATGKVVFIEKSKKVRRVHVPFSSGLTRLPARLPWPHVDLTYLSIFSLLFHNTFKFSQRLAIRLTSMPAGTVTVSPQLSINGTGALYGAGAISPGGVTVSPPSLIFTPSNYTVLQFVDLTVASDLAIFNYTSANLSFNISGPQDRIYTDISA